LSKLHENNFKRIDELNIRPNNLQVTDMSIVMVGLMLWQQIGVNGAFKC